MDNKDLLSMEDLAGVLNELNSMPDDSDSKKELSAEELASQKRYEEIIKKHKND